MEEFILGLVVVVGLIAIGAYILQRYLDRRGAKQDSAASVIEDQMLSTLEELNRDRHGNSQFASSLHKKYGISEGSSGISIGGGCQSSAKGHLLTIAGSGAGKGTNLIIPNLLGKSNYGGSWVVIDPKGQNAVITKDYQEDTGRKVICLNPWQIYPDKIGTSDTFNPLDFLDPSHDDFWEDCKMISEMVIPLSGGKNNHWDTSARGFLTLCLAHMITSKTGSNISDLFTLASGNNDQGTGADYGIASIFDADVLIYVASMLMEAHNKGLPTSPEIKVSKYDLLEFVGKATGGKSYQQLENALNRLQATSIVTTIRTEDGKLDMKGGFSWLADWGAVKKNGKPVAIRFRLNDWIYKGIIEKKLVLTIGRKYFELEGGLERFLYRLARKVAGNTNELKMKLDTVRKRSGTTRKPGAFRKLIEEIMTKQSIPEYWIFLATRSSTGDEYVVANQKARFKTYEDAYANISFVAMDRALIKTNRHKRR